ncbi:RluA family pseudouridine synthase [Akkermansiaceae bacterium]|nr:RluA family pseudouridine synthase [Akkermansiaceae bacterium]
MQSLTIPEPAGERLDAYLAKELSDLSRSRIQALIKSGHILLNETKVKAKVLLKAGDRITIEIPEPEALDLIAQDLPLEVIHEDEDLIVLNKAHGMVVHPAAGNPDGTLVNALLHHCKGQLAGIGGVERPGIVHRLDKDTSGCIVVAKTDRAHQGLVKQFAERETAKLYLAVAQSPPKGNHQTVFNNIARHPVHRQRMDVCNPGSGKPAITDLHLLHTTDDGTSLILCALHTGRTHQIRVHNRYMGHPLLADPIYSNPSRQKFESPRLMLHAWRLGFTHPGTGQWLQNEAPIPEEFHRWSDEASDRLEQVRAIRESKEYDALW